MNYFTLDPGHACWCKSCQPGLLLPETPLPVRDRHIAIRFGTFWQESNPTWWVALYNGLLVAHVLEAIPGDEDGAVQFFGEDQPGCTPHICRTCRVHICTVVLTGHVRTYEVPKSLWETKIVNYADKVQHYIAMAEESGLATAKRETCSSCGNTATMLFRVNDRQKGPRDIFTCADKSHQAATKALGVVLSARALDDSSVVHRTVV